MSAVFAKVFEEALRLPESLPPAEAEQARFTALFDAGIDYLRRDFPNQAVNRLCTLVWRVIGNRLALTAAVDDIQMQKVPGLHIGMVNGVLAVMIPWAWPALIKASPVRQLGGIVWTGGLLVDIGHGNVPPNELRAMGYEAEFLTTAATLDPEWKPDPYQAEIMTTLPAGLLSPKVASLVYPLQPLFGDW